MTARRVGEVTREELADAAEQAIWDHIAETHRGGVDGPYSVLIRVPKLAERVARLEDYFRFEMELPAADRELIILAVTREAEARFGWVVHERRAREVGTRPEAIEVLRALEDSQGLAPKERLLVDIARSLTRTRHIADDLYARAVRELGEQVLLEVVTLVGHYSLIGFVLNSFTVPPRATDAPPGF